MGRYVIGNFNEWHAFDFMEQVKIFNEFCDREGLIRDKVHRLTRENFNEVVTLTPYGLLKNLSDEFDITADFFQLKGSSIKSLNQDEFLEMVEGYHGFYDKMGLQ